LALQGAAIKIKIGTCNVTERFFYLIAKDHQPPNSLDLNPLDYHVGEATLEAYYKGCPKPKPIVELKEILQSIWDSLPQELIDQSVKEFRKRLKAQFTDSLNVLLTPATVKLRLLCFLKTLNT